MLQYLINSSIVWLACLLLFELLLRKESFHNANRAYLLVSLCAGLLLPMISMEQPVQGTAPLFSKPVAQVYEMKKSITVAQPAPTTMEITNTGGYNGWMIMWAIYLTGVLAGLGILLKEGVELRRLYKRGKKSKENGYTIVATGVTNNTYSFFHIIFTGNRQEYTSQQWNWLLAHEIEHARGRHSVDNLLVLLLRVLFWFNPLIHIYYKRVRMVHEYQADEAAANSAAAYGDFLLQQELMQGTPLLAHSFHYSPIKNRIIMLTKNKSAKTSMVKYAAVLPLVFILLLVCTQNSISGEKNEEATVVEFNGNKIEFGALKVVPFEYMETFKKQRAMYIYTSMPDSVPVKHWGTGEIKMQKVMTDMMPVAINNKPIYGNEQQYLLPEMDMKFKEPAYGTKDNTLYEYVFARLKDDLDKLDAGFYSLNINRLVIDDAGKIAYYEPEGIKQYIGKYDEKREINETLRVVINKKIVDILNNAAPFRPALKDGKPINVRTGLGSYEIVVGNHTAILVPRQGC